MDMNPISGTSYYRIKSIRTDGHFSISDIVSVNRKELDLTKKLNIHKIYPMPSGHYVNIDLESGGAENLNINLVNCLGELVFNSDYKVIPGQMNKLRIDIENLSTGVYTLIVNDKQSKKTRIEKIIISVRLKLEFAFVTCYTEPTTMKTQTVFSKKVCNV